MGITIDCCPAVLLLLLLLLLLVANGAALGCRQPRRTSWSNPCQYMPVRNRTGREASRDALKDQIQLAINEYNYQIAIGFNSTYGTSIKSKTRPPAGNRTESLKRLYSKLFVLGRKLEKAITATIKTEDNTFKETERCESLHKIKTRTMHVMCEIYDVLRKPGKTPDKSKVKKFNVEPRRIPRVMDVTQVSAVDGVLYNTYINLLKSLKKNQRKKRHKESRMRKEMKIKNKKHRSMMS